MIDRSCAGEHVVDGGPCLSYPPLIRCGACGVVRYCSSLHQRLHWREHKQDCLRFEEQMRRGNVLHDFPFTFAHNSTSLIDNGILSVCSFLESYGVHLYSFWGPECDCWTKSSPMSGLEDGGSKKTLGWNLPSHLCPCTGVNYEICQIDCWSDYYKWRQLPLNSPVSILLHWPLTLYHSLKLVSLKSPNKAMQREGSLRIHYLGPRKELDQLEVFAELCNLIQGQHIHIDFIGPDVAPERNQFEMELNSPPKCSDNDCACKLYSEREKNKGYLTVKLWKGFYHDVYSEIAKNSPPDFIFAANAGIAAFRSWLPTVKLITKNIGVPTVFTDFCEEAAILACKCLEATFALQLTIPMQANPFRQPMTPSNKVLDLPTYSNCFLFGIN